jgi:hypothetical protein
VSRTQNILWTGGWDSTFHLVRCLISDAVEIQPIYLIDESRSSTAMELLTMKRIKQKLRADMPARTDALLPTRFVAVSDLPENERIAKAFAGIQKRKQIGIQYDWLGRFCCQFGVSDLQLCIHKDDRAHHVLQRMVEEAGEDAGRYRVSEKFAGTDEYELFRHYRFPVFDLTKREMQSIAQQMAFSSIMALTWFCHAPRDGKPCGTCAPCRFTVEEGLGWRVPYVRRLKGTILSGVRRLARDRAKASALDGKRALGARIPRDA